MKITASSGMTVELPDTEYGVMLAKHGEQARYVILSNAGRVFKHRQNLKCYREQALTADQQAQVESVAKSSAIQFIIDTYLIENGYSAYVAKRNAGGMLPMSWSRTVDRARESCRDEIENVTVTDGDRDYAMAMLGFLTEDDRRWSERVSSSCNWQITVPDGWGGEKFSTVPLGF